MNGRTHLITGIATGMMIAHTMNAPLWLGAVAGGIGALLPDIDHPQSLLSAFIPFGFVVSWFTGSHRGITHSLVALGAVVIGAWILYTQALIPMVLALAFIGGYLIHLLGDMFTPMGVPLLFPLGFYFRFLPKFILQWTAFIFEAFAVVASVGLAVWVAWQQIY